MKPLLTRKADNRFIIFMRDMGLVIAGVGIACVADAYFQRPFALALLALAPVGYAARRYGNSAGLFSSFATAMLGMALHVTAERHPVLEEIWETTAGALFLGTTAFVIARLGKIEKRLIAIAATDPLTGIYNRRALAEATTMEIRRQVRSQRPLSMVHIDLDNFKKVNDSFGHSEGDKVLMAVANVLVSGRSTDTPARLGGDEFVVLLPDTSPQSARVMVDRLRFRLKDALKPWDVTCSIGIATFMRPAESAEHLIHSADTQMYDVKRASKDGVRQVVIDGDHTTSLLQAQAVPTSKSSEASVGREYVARSE